MLRQRGPAAASFFACLLLTGCAVPPSSFSPADARAHLDALAGSIGSRPIGSQRNIDARTYLIDRLSAYGFTVEVQETETSREDLGIRAHVANIVATRAGEEPDAIALVAHYDSVADGPGAADDAFGTAVVLEAARALTLDGHRYTLVVLLTDGEEAGLLGAASAAANGTFDRVRAYVNVEAIGSDGPLLLFETGPGNKWLVDAWTRSPAPRGASYAREIYRHLPRDTDFSMLQRTGVPGLNLALVGDGYSYHTDRDAPDRISDRTLASAGATVVGLVETLEGMNLGLRTDDPDVTFFDVAGLFGVSYSAGWTDALGIAGLVAGALAWWRVVRRLAAFGLRAVLGTVGDAFVLSAAAVAAMLGATWLLRATREVYHPWYAHPDRFFLLLALAGATGAWLAGRLLSILAWPRAIHPAAVWCCTLPLWMVLAGLSVTLAPGAAFLWTIPLLAAAIGLVVVPLDRPQAVRAVATVVFMAAGLFWTRDAWLLARFAVTTLGFEPLVTPIWVYPGIMTATAVMLVPPAFGACRCSASRFARTAITAGLLLVLTGAFAAAYVAPAYTSDRPQRRSLRYVHDVGHGAFWELDGNEPGPGVAEDHGPTGWYAALRERRAERRTEDLIGREQRFRRQRGLPDLDVGTREERREIFERTARPFRYRAAAPLAPAPATVEARLDTHADEAELSVTVRPTEPETTISLILPIVLRPLRSNVPGTVRLLGWRATYIPPLGGSATFQIVLGKDRLDELKDARVVVSRTGLPGAEPGSPLPAWVLPDPATWTTRAEFVMPLPAPDL